MKTREILKSEDSDLDGLKASFDHHVNRLKKHIDKGVVVHPNTVSHLRDNYGHPWLAGWVVPKDHPRLRNVQFTSDRLSRLVDKATDLKPGTVPADRHKEAVDFLNDVCAYLERTAERIAFSTAGEFNWLTHSELPLDIDEFKTFVHVGGDRKGDMYVKKSLRSSQHAVFVGELYDMIGTVMWRIDLFEKGMKDARNRTS